jgi:hypothetical protein
VVESVLVEGICSTKRYTAWMARSSGVRASLLSESIVQEQCVYGDESVMVREYTQYPYSHP